MTGSTVIIPLLMEDNGKTLIEMVVVLEEINSQLHHSSYPPNQIDGYLARPINRDG